MVEFQATVVQDCGLVIGFYWRYGDGFNAVRRGESLIKYFTNKDEIVRWLEEMV